MIRRTAAPPSHELKSAIVRDPLIASPQTAVLDAIALMSGADGDNQSLVATTEDSLRQLHQSVRSSCVCVVEAERIVGILTERSIIRLVSQRQPLDNLRLEQVMTPVVVTLQASAFTDADLITDCLQQQAVRYLPTVDEQDGLVGIVTPESLGAVLADRCDSRLADAQLNGQNSLLAQIASGAPLAEILTVLIQSMEQALDGAICSVLLLDQENRLRHGAAPSLPFEYIQAIDGVLIGEGVGSCGTAIFRKETIIVSNIAEDPLWQDYREIALKQNLQACWSTPIIANDGQVLGAFGVYYQAVRSPQPSELESIARMVHLAGVAIKYHQAKVDLQKSEARWQFALEGAGVGVWDWNGRENTVFYSQQWKAMLGYEDHEIENSQEAWERLIHPEDRAHVQDIVDHYFRGEIATYENEHRLRCKDGSYKWVLARGKAFERAADGTALRVSGTHTDISDRKQAEAALQKNEAHLRALINAIPDLIMRINREGIYLEFLANPNFQIIGNLSDFVGEHVSETLPAHLIQRRVKAIERAFQTRSIQTFEQDLCFDGQTQHEEVRVVPYSEDEVLLLVRDITARKQAELALQQSEAQSRAILAAIPDFLFRVGADGVYRDFVTPYREFDLVPQGVERIGRSLSDLLPTEIANRHLHYLQQALQIGEPQIYEQRVQIGDRIQEEEIRVVRSGDDEALFMVRDISERKQAEAQLQNLVAGTAAKTGQEFFPALVTHIAAALDVAYVYVNERVGNRLHPLASWADGTLEFPLPFDFASTPCERTLHEGQFYCENSVQQAFPGDLDLVNMSAENYLGIALQNAQGETIGDLCILNRQPIPDAQRAEQILQIFAARAAAELERQQALTSLQQLNQSLEDRVTERTAELQEREQFLQTVLDSFPLSVFWKNRDSVYLGGNRQFLESTGLSSVADLIGKTDYELPRTTEEANAYRANDQQVIDSATPMVGIIEPQTMADGIQIWLETNKVPLHNLMGDVVGVLGTFQDISDRKRAEVKMRQQLAAIEAAVDGIGILQGHRYVSANQAHLRLFGYEHSEELIGQDWRRLYSAEEQARFEQEIFPLLERDRSWQGEAIATRKDGSTFVEGLSLTLTEDGLLICVCRDISARKAIEKALTMTETAVDLAGEAVFWTRSDGSFHHVNEAACSMLGYRREELLTRSVMDINPDIASIDWQGHWEDIKQQQSLTIESRHQTKDGRIYPVEIHTTYLAIEGEAYKIALVRDISERKQAEAKLRRYERIVSATVDGVALVDSDYIYQIVNQVYLQRTGKVYRAIVGHSVADLHGETVFESQIKPKLDRCLAGEVVEYEDWFVFPNVGHRFINVNYAPYREVDDTISGVLVSTRDITARRQAELIQQQLTQELAEWRERYDIAAQASGQVLFEHDLATDHDTWGPNAETILGYPTDELPENIEGYLERIHPEDRAAFRCVLDNDRKARTPYRVEFRFRDAEGTYRWIEERGMTRYSAQGEPVQVIGYWRDISELKQAELIQQHLTQELAAWHDRYNIAAWASGQVLFEYDLKTEEDTWGPNIEAVLGHATESLHQNTPDLMHCIHPDDRAAFQQILDNDQTARTPYQVEFRYRRPDGHYVWIEERGMTRYDAHGEPVQVIGYWSDISDRKAAERALKMTQSAVDLAAEGIFWIRPDGRFHYANEAACLMLGYDQEELLSLSVSDIDGYFSAAGWQQHWHDIQQLHNFSFESLYRAKDGDIFPVEISVNYLNLEGEEYNFAFVRNISDRKQTEAALVQSEAKSRAILAALPDLIIRVGTDGIYRELVANRPGLEAFLNGREPAGIAIADVVPTELAQQLLHYIEQAVNTQQMQIYEQQVLVNRQYRHEEVRIIQSGEDEVILLIRDISDRKRSETQLRKNQAILAEAQRIAHLGNLEFEIQSQNVTWSEELFHIFGLDPNCLEPSYEDFLQLVHPDDRQPLQQRAESALTTGTSSIIDYRVVQPDGSLRYHEGRIEVERNTQGQVVRLSGTALDITERKQAELALQLKTEELDRFFSLALDLLCIANTAGYFLRLNHQWEKALGYPLAELEGARFIDYVHPEDVDDTVRIFAQTQAGGKVLNFVNRYRCRDGSYRWIEWRSVTHKDFIYAAARDITERKQTEAKLENSRAFYRAIIADQTEMICRFLPDGTLTFVNDAYCQFFQKTPKELIGHSFLSFLPEEAQAASLRHLSSLTLASPVKTIEHQVFAPDGKRRWQQWTDRALYDPASNLLEFQSVGRDITDLKEAEAALRGIEAERLRAEETRKALELLEQVIDTVLAGYWDWDIPNHRQYLSPGFKRMFGYEDHELPDTPEACEGLFWPEDLATVHTCLERHIQSRGTIPYYNEVRCRHKDGSVIWVIHSGQVIEWDEAGAPLRMIGCHIDISDRKEAEAAVQQESSFREQILENMAEGVCVYHDTNEFPHRRFTVWNQQMQEITGYTLAEINHSGWEQSLFTHADNRRQVMARMQPRHQDEALVGEKWEIQRKDGQQRTIAVSTSILLNHQGHIHVLALIQDITERTQSELATRQQAERGKLLLEIGQRIRQSLDLQTIFDTACQEIRSVLGADRVGIFKFSRGAEFNWGEFVAESVMAPFRSVVRIPIQDHCFGEEFATLFKGGQLSAVEDIHRYGFTDCYVDLLQQLEIRANLVLPLLCNHELWGLLSIHQCSGPRNWQQSEIDFTQRLATQLAIAIRQANLFDQLNQELAERQQAQAQLSERNQQLAIINTELARATRLKDEFLANMSHELRTPLNAILGMTEGLQGQVFGTINTEQAEALQTIERSGSHLLALINDILDVSKIEAGQITLDKTLVCIATLCHSSVALVRQAAQQKNIQIAVEQPYTLPELYVDERRLRQVLLNLLDNAIKFTPDGGMVTLEATCGEVNTNSSDANDSSSQNSLRIAVSDTGIGIDDAHLDKLFQPFVQIDSALNRQHTGTGLGLTLVKRIVELHGGQVEVTSQLGIGSCFTLTLPCTIAPRTAAETDVHPVLSTQPSALQRTIPPLILLAEDNEASIKTTSRYLSAKGYRMLIARNGQAAIALAQAEQPDLILMDIQMPSMDGLEAIQQLRRDPDFGQVPIIAVTALAMPGDRDRCLTAGANEYLSKPIRLKQLATVIQQLLGAFEDGS